MLSLSRRGCIATWKLTAAKRQTWQRRRLSEASHERHRSAGSEGRVTSIGDINYEKNRPELGRNKPFTPDELDFKSLLATSQHQRRGVRFESEQQAADGLQVSGMDTDVLADRMDIAERALDRAGGVERRRSTCEVNEVDCLHRARNRVPARQPYLHSLRNCRA